MKDSGLVLLPGTLCDERLYRFQEAEFPGSRVLDLRHSPTMESMIGVVESVARPEFVLVGFSMGGHIAQEFALRHPDRVERLVVIGSSSEGYPPDEKKVVLSSLPLIERGKFHGITDKRLREFLHPDAYADSEIRTLVQDMAGEDAKEVYLRQIRATLDRRDLKEEMKGLSVPVLFIGGADDQIVSIESIERSARSAKRGRFLSVPDCGHFVPLEKPEATNRAIREWIG